MSRDPIVNAKARAFQAFADRMQLTPSWSSLPISPIEEIFLWEVVAHTMRLDIALRTRFGIRDAWKPEVATAGLIAARSPEMKDLYSEFRIQSGEAPDADLPVYRHLAIECDGHDYHERSKKQAAHDRSRDRFFLEQGLSLMRFTGSELHRDGPSCARQALKFLHPFPSAFLCFDEYWHEEDAHLSSFRSA